MVDRNLPWQITEDSSRDLLETADCYLGLWAHRTFIMPELGSNKSFQFILTSVQSWILARDKGNTVWCEALGALTTHSKHWATLSTSHWVIRGTQPMWFMVTGHSSQSDFTNKLHLAGVNCLFIYPTPYWPQALCFQIVHSILEKEISWERMNDLKFSTSIH